MNILFDKNHLSVMLSTYICIDIYRPLTTAKNKQKKTIKLTKLWANKNDAVKVYRISLYKVIFFIKSRKFGNKHIFFNYA